MDFKNLTLKEKAEVYKTLASIETNLLDDLDRKEHDIADLTKQHIERTEAEENYSDSWEATYVTGQIDDAKCAVKAIKTVLEHLNKLS